MSNFSKQSTGKLSCVARQCDQGVLKMSSAPDGACGCERANSWTQLAVEAERGNWEGLLCPVCQRESVAVWFSNPVEEVFRTWFICDDCGSHSRAQNTARPKFFSEERRRTDLEQRDREIVDQAVFKPPDKL